MRFFGKRRSKKVVFGTLGLLAVGLAVTIAFAGSAGHYSWYPYHGGHGHNHYRPVVVRPVVVPPVVTVPQTNTATMNQVINASNNIVNDIQGNRIGGVYGYGYGSHYRHGHPYGHGYGYRYPYGGGYDNDAVDIENISQGINILVNGNIDQR